MRYLNELFFLKNTVHEKLRKTFPDGKALRTTKAIFLY